MNERIRQLFETHVYPNFGDKHNLNKKYNGEYVSDVLEDHWQTFQEGVELAAKECMLQCIKVENDVELSDYQGGFKDGALLCYQEIQEHFGIE